MRGSAWWCLAAATGALLGVPSVAQAISAGSTILVSRPSGDGPLAPGVVNASRVGNHAVSDDGCRTVFDSRADGISPEDDDDRLGLFVRDSCTNTTVFVSRATGAAGAPANADALKAAISGDGTKVAFRTRATNLSAADSDTALDIYVRDLTLGTTTLVSRASGAAGAKQNGGECDDPTLSDDGSRVAFSCNATNLHPDDADTSVDVYLRDLTAATTSLVSRADTAAGAKADDSARDPAISGDGGTVAFATSATNLVAGDTDSLSDVIARDLSAQTNTLVSRQSGAAGAKSTTTSDSPDVDQDGSAVAFRSFGLGEGSGQVYVRDLTAATTTLASRATGAGGTVADSGSDQPSISDDGSRVTFSTSAANLAAADVNGRGDVYARNLLANTTTLVSATAGIGGDDTSGPGAISGNGLVVAFTTTARNLLADDADGFEVVARRVLSQNSPVLVSRPSGSGAFGGDGTAESSIPGASAASEDGRIVGFSSRTDTLSPEDDNRRRNAFVRDMRTGETRFVGRASGASGAPADADANVVAVSADGRRVAFTSQATNLGEVVPANRTQLWVRDLDTQQTLLVSRADGVGGAPADFGVFTGALSADGRRVSFSSLATNLVPGVSSLQVYVRDLAAGTTVVASRADGALGAPAPGGAEADHDLSADGRRVAFGSESAALGADGSHTQIFVRDLEAGTTTLASRANGAAGAPGQFDSRSPALDADGSRVAFETFSANLVLDDADTNRDVIVRDLATAQTILVSRASGAAGVKADAGGEVPSISLDGGRVLFLSSASNLTAGPPDATKQQAYLRDLAAATTTLAARGDGAAGVAAGPIAARLVPAGNCVVFSSSRRDLTAAYAGEHTQVYLRALDGECPDVTGPDTVITSGPDGTESSFTFSASEPDARFECRLDGAAFVGCTSPIASGPIAPGAHRFEVRAVDRFGNADLSPAARDFQVAGPAPPGAGSAAAPGRVRLVGGTTLRAARDGAVRMRLACPRATTGCRGTARLLGRPRGKRRGALLASRAFSVPAGATRTVTLRLRGPARTSARRSAGLRAVLELTATGLSGRRSVNVVIRPGRGGR